MFQRPGPSSASRAPLGPPPATPPARLPPRPLRRLQPKPGEADAPLTRAAPAAGPGLFRRRVRGCCHRERRLEDSPLLPSLARSPAKATDPRRRPPAASSRPPKWVRARLSMLRPRRAAASRAAGARAVVAARSLVATGRSGGRWRQGRGGARPARVGGSPAPRPVCVCVGGGCACVRGIWFTRESKRAFSLKD